MTLTVLDLSHTKEHPPKMTQVDQVATGQVEIASAKHPRRILVEIGVLGALYAIYTFVRNNSHASEALAFSNAKHIIRYEKYLWMYVEQPIHKFFLSYEWIIISANYFYGSFHFIVTIYALCYVFIHDAKRYSHVRNTIVIGTLIALAGFVTFPLMPPRLLPDSYNYIDTLAKYPTFWSFNSKEFAAISNQFAAMPSVHIVWAVWCLFALFPYTKKLWLKILLCAYPCATFFVIIVTSNHFILDAVAGLAVFFVAYWVSRMITSLTTRSAIDNTASLADISAR